MASAPLTLHIVTFNCGRSLVDVDHFAAALRHSFRDLKDLPGLICLSLQEIAPIAQSFLGGSLLAPYFAHLFRAVQKAADAETKYRHVITHNVGMTAIMILAAPQAFDHFRSLEVAEVGVGWSECGNKGAAAVRIGYSVDDTAVVPLTLVAAHLAAQENAFEQRNQDWKDIVSRLVFRNSRTTSEEVLGDAARDPNPEEEPLLATLSAGSAHAGSISPMFVPGSPVFFAGDLNYRTSDVGPTDESFKSFPQPRSDKSDPLHFSLLLAHDQLRRERLAGHTLHNLEEDVITFPPTYKFSDAQQEAILSAPDGHVDTWLWSKHRFPSWCDRVLFSAPLYNSTALKVEQYTALPIQPTSDHKPVALTCKLDLKQCSSLLSAQKSPFTVEDDWSARRHAARRKEIAIGTFSYLGLTWEGNGIVAASLIGAIGGYLVLSSLISA